MSSILADNIALPDITPNAGGGGSFAGFQPISTAVHRSPSKLWRSNSIINLCYQWNTGTVFCGNRNFLNLVRIWNLYLPAKSTAILWYWRKILVQKNRAKCTLHSENIKFNRGHFQMRKYMSDLDSTHCTPLPRDHFLLPWDPATELAFETIESDSSKL